MSYRIVASALLSRAPLVLPPLTPLEASYYAYQRTLHRALSKPLALSTSWFFKQGSTAEQSFLLSDQKAGKEKGAQGEVDEAFEEVLVREIDGTLEVSVAVETEADRTNDRTSLTRALSRTLYLLVKKPRSSHAWQFPQGGVNSNESLLKAALRELHEETGKDIDVWPTGRVPAAAYSYPLLPSPTSSFTSTRVFFLPMQIIRGSPKVDGKEVVEHAWLTKEEIRDVVSEDYWDAVEGMLSDL